MTSSAAAFRSATSATACTVVWTVLEPSLAVSGSVVPPDETEAELDRIVPSSTEDATVTCTVKSRVAPAARVSVVEQVKAWPTAEHAGSDAPGWNEVPAGSASLTEYAPTWSDGPWFVTVSV